MSKRAYIAVFLLPVLLLLAGLPALGPVGAAPAAPGDLDPTFGSGGRVTTDVAAGDFDEVHALLTQPDGKIVALGEGAPYDQQSLVAVRYNANGSLDTSFGSGGAQTIFLQGSYHDGALAGALQADGKIIMAGYAGEVIGGTPAFVAGPPHTGAKSAAGATAPAGRAPANPNSYSDILVVRLNADGSLDTGFGSGGGVIANIADHAVDEADGVAVQPDGKIVVAGTTQANTFSGDFVTIRLNADGSPDTSFGTNAVVITDFNGSDDAASAMALQSDGKIVVAGHASTQGLWDVGLVRYNTNGSLDATFGNGGKVMTDVLNLNDWAHDVLVQPDGKIVIAGGSQHYCGNQCTEDYTTFARYNTNGSLDAGFGSGGTVLDNNHVGAQGLVRQSDGTYFYGVWDYSAFILGHLTAGGSIDTSFGTNGFVTTTFPNEDSGATIDTLTLQADGRLLAGGTARHETNNGPNGDFALARYLTAGSAPPPTDTPRPGPTDTPQPGPTNTPQPGPTDTPAPTNTPGPTVTPGGCNATFSDVHSTDYFYTPVTYLACHGIISGYADGTFRPYNNTTRGQLSKIIVGAEGWAIDTSGGPHFSDVPPTNAFYPFIETAYHHGVISGYADGTFRWGANVTRGQLSKIVVVAQGWAIDTSGGPHFSDVPDTNPFYGFVETAYHHNIISGYADGTFRLGANATRGQIAKIVYGAITP